VNHLKSAQYWEIKVSAHRLTISSFREGLQQQIPLSSLVPLIVIVGAVGLQTHRLVARFSFEVLWMVLLLFPTVAKFTAISFVTAVVVR
jgi:hypothetical protein